ncbi:hypothetical protein ACRYCC_08840 [Actinomadura scrupuli]|uniref:hypothetical protein n=1 Tax=Actinomadura scrupuli TaxID=559629 RepID=UPI003D96E918
MGAPSETATPQQEGPANSGLDGGRRTVRRAVAAAAVLSVLLGVAGGLQSRPGRDLLRDAGLTARPAGYTELAFADPRSLPRRSSATSMFVAPAFVIRNVMGGPQDYTWSLLLTTSGQTREAASGRATLADGQAVTITPLSRIPCTPGPLTVGVRLGDGIRSIRFLTTCTSDADDTEGRSG